MLTPSSVIVVIVPVGPIIKWNVAHALVFRIDGWIGVDVMVDCFHISLVIFSANFHYFFHLLTSINPYTDQARPAVGDSGRPVNTKKLARRFNKRAGSSIRDKRVLGISQAKNILGISQAKANTEDIIYICLLFIHTKH